MSDPVRVAVVGLGTGDRTSFGTSELDAAELVAVRPRPGTARARRPPLPGRVSDSRCRRRDLRR